MSHRGRSPSRSYSPPPRRGEDVDNREPSTGTSLWIQNLSRSARHEDIRDLLKDWQIKDLHLPVDHYTKERRKFGFIEFFNVADTDAALAFLHEKELCGKVMNVSVAQRGRRKRDEFQRRGRDYNFERNDRYYNNYRGKRIVIVV